MERINNRAGRAPTLARIPYPASEKIINAPESIAQLALRDATLHVAADGRLSAEAVRAFRRARRRSSEPRTAPLAEPEILGKFESLPPAARAALVAAIARDDRWRLAAFDLGRGHAVLVRALRRVLACFSRWTPTRYLLEVLVSAVQSGSAFALHALSRRISAARGRWLSRPQLGDLFAAEGLDTRRFVPCYARDIPQPVKYRAFWHDADSHTTVGLVVGIDLIENADGFWFVESNLDCDLARRTPMYEGTSDPLIRRLLDFTAAGGYRRLVVLPAYTSVDPAMVSQYDEEGRARGVSVAVIENAFRPRFGHPKSIGVPPLRDPMTLLVRNRYVRTSVDYVVQNKRAAGRALRLYREHSGDSSFQLPPTSDAPLLGATLPADPFPNVVFKFTERDNGAGVFFLKASSASHARELLGETLRKTAPADPVSRIYSRFEDPEGIFQPYIPTPLTKDRRLRRTRAYILLTPVGVEYLCAHRLVCANPVPLELPFGIVRDPQPYLVSSRPGRRLEIIPPDEERSLRNAALGIARGLAWAIEYGFQTGSRSGDDAQATNPRT